MYYTESDYEAAKEFIIDNDQAGTHEQVMALLAFWNKNDKSKKAAAKKPAKRKAPAKSNEFKAMRGSAKQKKWANDLRSKLRSRISDSVFALFRDADESTDAKFWIDNRNLSADKMIEKIEAAAEEVQFNNLKVRVYMSGDSMEFCGEKVTIRGKSGDVGLENTKAAIKYISENY